VLSVVASVVAFDLLTPGPPFSPVTTELSF